MPVYCKHWTVEELPWDTLDLSKVDADVEKLAKAAALVEYNARTYTAYLLRVFHDDPQFQELARRWEAEEVQHGAALGAWAEKVDPSWNLERAFARFTAGYHVPLQGDTSNRGSRSGEMVARCMVEIGTSSYYKALGDATTEPVLKAICRHIEADELRHYKLFYTNLKRYLEKEKLSRWGRLRIAFGRIAESEDDELAYAWYAANVPDGTAYRRKDCSDAYAGRAFRFYTPQVVDRAVGMIFKACGLKPHSRLHVGLTRFANWYLTRSTRRGGAKAEAELAAAA